MKQALPKFILPPQSRLVSQVRDFWFNNTPGSFFFNDFEVSRSNLYIHGGPNPWLTHPVSQEMEWLSRLRQADLFKPHDSPEMDWCRTLCERQGDELWTHFHQNFDFALACDERLQAPRCICILPDEIVSMGSSAFTRFMNPRCDQFNLVLKRRLARACQVNVTATAEGVKWAKYDFLLTMNLADNRKFKRPQIPVILWCHDFWPQDKGYQNTIDWLEPDVVCTAYPSPWENHFRMPAHTRIVFAPFAPSLFFTRPQLNPAGKNCDLLVIGKTSSPIYFPRIFLDATLRPLTDHYRIEFSHKVGAGRNVWDGATVRPGANGPVYYLNQWSAYLGRAKYVIFGRLASDVHQFVLGKYYEALGSGAIPILPEVPDLDRLAIRPFEHFIPLTEVEGKTERLAYFLDHYDEYSYIAANAVAWTRAHIDRLLFDDFEDLVHEIIGKKYPKRLLD